MKRYLLLLVSITSFSACSRSSPNTPSAKAVDVTTLPLTISPENCKKLLNKEKAARQSLKAFCKKKLKKHKGQKSL